MTDKITIKGVPPQFDEKLLKELQAARHIVYEQTDESTAFVRGEIPVQFLTSVIDHHDKGYTLNLKYPVSFGHGSYWCRMDKPDSIKIDECQALDSQVKQEYIADLEREHQKYKDLLTAQLLQAAQLKEKKKIEDAHKKRMTDIEKEVNDTFGELVVPD
ncbi:hypothetical protein HX793_22285 [Pseudomonas reactans]|uniref:hypothetical protein n=1 Tax=Pseudomonas reactans TaxID=117680 RepID=UPI0015BE2B2F|nr:hypothetical protein [Pseudomonas reactans]NWA44703.1 hypothetical protein [Pseudomonas reactans]NWD32515.1 hypothetical protein [Pseudomonas reactans]